MVECRCQPASTTPYPRWFNHPSLFGEPYPSISQNPELESLQNWRKMMATSEDVLVTVAGDSGHAWPRQNSLRWLQDETGSTFLHQHVWLVPRKYTCDLWYIVSAPQDSKWIPCCWWALIWLQEMFASISRAFRSSPVAVTLYQCPGIGMCPRCR